MHALTARELPNEWESLIPLVTIKESYFFRAPQQFDVIRQRILPALVKARSATRQLRIWSAACARGEEPATIAMLLAEEPTLLGWSWTIVATDVDEEALAGARIGLYAPTDTAAPPAGCLGSAVNQAGQLETKQVHGMQAKTYVYDRAGDPIAQTAAAGTMLPAVES